MRRKKKGRKEKKRKKKTTRLDDPEPVGAQLQDLQFRERLLPLDRRELVRGDVQLLPRPPGARVRGLPGERAQGLDLVVRQLEAAQGGEGREVRDRGQLVVVEDELLEDGCGGGLRDA